MQYNFKVSKEEKEKIFHTDFVKYGVRHDKAAKAAKILAAGKAEELWTEEEKKLVTQVCQQWLMNHKRYKKLQEHMDL
ncbi:MULTISPECIES: hypothetical protein [Calothrix]|uniref:Uncharacterized protein n=2 Tax=Calothrix TaxID=1186 RepID=A0ABR8AGP2_9CYAN|nr:MULTISPECIES: hypothetical protein [Calothrix]MBD2198191.1 hypothetical protein [Calothrix parietina FACHB-288]MBD2227357.1 hypothetical protein [Calothrix anomala FACHB-343]